jgi:ribosomal RNA assembly protein
MELVYIVGERLSLLKKDHKDLKQLEAICNCSIKVNPDDAIEVSGEAYGEFLAKGVLQAYGRGFEMKVAMLLVNDDYYFSTIDLGLALGNEKRVHRIKARVIGEDGRTKTYIESVSGVKMSVYGDTVSFIGSHTQINEAETAVSTLVEGGTHKLAYLKMEAAHRKNKERAHDPRLING